MAFLYFYDLIDFDADGRVKATKKYTNLNKAESNFLYLVAKYNQNIVKENSVNNEDSAVLPPFFKQELAPLLSSVESGEKSKEYALRVILANCCDEVKKASIDTKSDKELVLKLSSLVDVNAENYAKKFKKAVNKKQLEYVITQTAGNLMNEISNNVLKVDSDAKVKSSVYKKVISYNGLMSVAANIDQLYGQIVAK